MILRLESKPVLKPKTFTKAGHNRAVVSAAVALGVLVAGSLPVCGIRINTSYSLPMGVYVRTSDPRAGLIEFCPEGRFAAESSARGYRSPGFCPDGAVPLLKPVVAQPGDTVEMSAAGIAVNGRLLAQTAPVAKDRRGRLLKPYATGLYTVAQGTVWVASSYNRGSYDSRYMGPIPTHLIRARLKPLWTFSR
jgi:conjugative transfer signal peptidase TraF